MRYVTAALAFAMLAACGKASDKATADSASARLADSGMAGMHMTGMPSQGAGSGAMMQQMQANMQMMQGMSPDSMRMMMQIHQQMGDSMLAKMSKEMTDMKMPADARFTALMDSVKADMAAMPAHHDRMARLMGMHQTMMAHKPPPA